MKFKVGDRVKVINAIDENHLNGEQGVVVEDENHPNCSDCKLGDVCVRLDFDPSDTYIFREDEIELFKNSPPEYIPVGTSIDRWIKNPEFKAEYDSLEGQFKILN